MKNSLSDPAIKFFISVLGLVVIFIVLKELQHIFIPLIIAYFLYFVFEPLNNFLVKNKIPQSIAVVADLIIILLIMWGISSVIINAFSNLSDQLPVYEQKLNNLISITAISIGITDPVFTQFNISNILSELDYGGIASGFFSSTLSVFSTAFFVLFFFIFVSSGHKKILNAVKKRYVEKNIRSELKIIKKEMKNDVGNNDSAEDRLGRLKSKREKKIENTFKEITAQVQKYISAKFLISLSTGVLVGFMLWLFGVNFFIVWGVMAFLLNFIPNIGSVISVILPGIMTLVQFESFGYALIVVAVITVVQNVLGNILEPKIFGDQLGLNPLVILFSLLLWGYIWGIVGMFISVPLTAIIKIINSSSGSKNMNFIGELMSN